ncbi:T9SS type A sorting domain-containing protein [candidate division KSB1 bacterium]|nr:T9SS type A sorting domain-containing protein [candidate division KSB1 bacterium]
MKKIVTEMRWLLALLVLLPMIAFAAGDAGSALEFDPTNNELATIPDNALLDNMASNYTMEIWVNPTDLTAENRILHRSGVFVLYLDNTGKVLFESKNGAGVTITSVGSLPANSWSHVAVTFDGATNTVRLYIDGALDNSQTDALFSLVAGTDPIIIGNNLAGGHGFEGQLDELRLWTSTRTATQIANNMGSSLALPAANLLAYYKMDGTGQTLTDSGSNGLDGYLGTADTDTTQDPARVDSTAPIGFRLVSPNGGAYNIGDPLNVEWSVDASLTNVHLYISFDGGGTWNILAFNTDNDGLFSTFVPGKPTTNAIFRVADPNDDNAYDDSDNPITFVDAGAWQREIVLEAEDANLTKPMISAIDGLAYDCEFIYSYNNGSGTAEFNFNVPVGGTYILWGRAWGAGSTRNSFYISIDGSDEYLWDTTKGAEWRYDFVSHRGPSGVPNVYAEVDPLILTLPAGAHTIVVRGRENYTELDRLVLTNDLNKTYWGKEPDRWINLTSPLQKDEVTRGGQWEITWDSKNLGSYVTIELSFDYGKTWPVTIAQTTANDGSYLWNVGDYSSDVGMIRISAGHGGSCPWDMNWRRFVFIDPQPVLLVTAPNGGEEWKAGTQQDIAWAAEFFNGLVNIDLSTDNGANWVTIAVDQPAAGTFNWPVLNQPTDEALVRVYDAADGTPSDTSDAPFTILPPDVQPPEPGDLQVVFPNGGEFLVVGNEYNIHWDSDEFAGLVDVAVSLDNGATWTVIAEDQPDSGATQWTVPNMPTEEGWVRVFDAADGAPADTSDNPFAVVTEAPPQETNFALKFDGMDDFVEIANHPSLNVAENFTIEFWIKTDNPTQSWTRILEKGSWDEYYVGFYGNQGRMHGALRTDIGNGYSKMTIPLGPSQTSVQENEWYHVAATYDGTTATLFINGVAEGTKTADASPRSLLGDLIIGAVKRPVGYDFKYEKFLDATLDEVRIWNYARSTDELNNNMFAQLTGAEDGLAAYYPFDEGTGQAANDMSANGNHGRLGMDIVDDSADPMWIVSDRPTTAAALAQSTPASQPTEEFALAAVPEEFSLEQNYPNPFNAGTTITFNIPQTESGFVQGTLAVYDLQGRLIKSLANGAFSAGQHQFNWDGTNSDGDMASSGVYFYHLKAGDFTATKRMLMLK